MFNTNAHTKVKCVLQHVVSLSYQPASNHDASSGNEGLFAGVTNVHHG